MQIVIFDIKGKRYGIPSDEVVEITEPMEWTTVPKTPKWVLGLINLRGNVLSLLNFDNFLNNHKDEGELCYNNTVIVKRKDGTAAFATGLVQEVADVDETAIQMREEQAGEAISGFLSLDGSIINLIDLQALFLKNEG